MIPFHDLEEILLKMLFYLFEYNIFFDKQRGTLHSISDLFQES